MYEEIDRQEDEKAEMQEEVVFNEWLDTHFAGLAERFLKEHQETFFAWSRLKFDDFIKWKEAKVK